MNFFSHHIRSLLHQDHGNPDTELSRHRHNGHPGSFTARMSVANQAEKLSELSVLSDRRPGSLDHFTSQAFISRAGDRTPIGSLSGGVLSGDQTQKPSQLADVSKLSPIADAGQKLTGHNPADARHTHHILDTLGQFRIVLAEAADLSGRLKDLLLVKLQAVQQLIKLKAHGRGAREFSQFVFDHERPLAACGSGGKLHPFHKQQRFDALLHPHHLVDKGVAQLGEVTKLAIKRARNMDPFELAPTQILGQSDTVEPIGLHSLSWRFGNHRWRGDQAPKLLRHQPIIQSVACRSSLIGKSHPLIGKVLTYVVHQMLYVVRYAQRFKQSLMIRKGHRDAALVHIESGKHIVVTKDECLVAHRSASFGSTAKNLTIVHVTAHSSLLTTSLIQVSGRRILIIQSETLYPSKSLKTFSLLIQLLDKAGRLHLLHEARVNEALGVCRRRFGIARRHVVEQSLDAGGIGIRHIQKYRSVVLIGSFETFRVGKLRVLADHRFRGVLVSFNVMNRFGDGARELGNHRTFGLDDRLARNYAVAMQWDFKRRHVD